ncbi:hypothetical protein G5B37_07300 [Rasiella rasia]|uniref:Uncharacterized protein n=1 Tax=Rasiella rasia TaxID=2744027 RepID=A0A6G6GLB0_9FLAO|nr:hypothetical protein [Rasiella rasia]QIE59376.1 hypothetical protein G5B37_07300 [Rasiella rasia]
MKQIFSIALSLLLLLSSSGIAYAQHFCGDFEMMATFTIGEKSLSCGMASVDDGCEDEEAEEHTCCDNQYTKVTTDDNFSTSQDTFQVPTNFVAAFVSVFVLQFETSAATEVAELWHYKPPPLIKNIPVLYETFLI